VAQPLTVRDLLQEGEPLWPSELLEGEGALDNPVAWVVSLRPYTPAFPRMRGEELALVSTENLARLDLPPTLADVIRQLGRLQASAVAVRGEVDSHAREAAREVGLPLLHLPTDAPISDIEQAVMRECAMRQALAEVQPQTGAEWLYLERSRRAATAAPPALRLLHRAGIYRIRSGRDGRHRAQQARRGCRSRGDMADRWPRHPPGRGQP
jgi:hypothetical protein